MAAVSFGSGAKKLTSFEISYNKAIEKIIYQPSDSSELMGAIQLISKYHKGGGLPMPSNFNHDNFPKDRIHNAAEKLYDLVMHSQDKSVSDAGLGALQAIRREFDSLGFDYMEFMSDFDPRPGSSDPSQNAGFSGSTSSDLNSNNQSGGFATPSGSSSDMFNKLKS